MVEILLKFFNFFCFNVSHDWLHLVIKNEQKTNKAFYLLLFETLRWSRSHLCPFSQKLSVH